MTTSPTQSPIRTSGQPVCPSPIVLLYLFADRCLPAGDRLTGIPVPGSQKYVLTTDLTRMLLASVLWNLRQRGVLQLARVQTKRLVFLKRQQVQVTTLSHPSELKGVEGSIVAVLREQPETARDLLRRWFVRDRASAYAHVIHEVVREAASQGLIDSEEMGSLNLGLVKVGGMGTSPKGHVNAAALAELEPEFVRVQVAWDGFRKQEPEIYQALIDDCGRAIKSRQARAT